MSDLSKQNKIDFIRLQGQRWNDTVNEMDDIYIDKIIHRIVNDYDRILNDEKYPTPLCTSDKYFIEFFILRYGVNYVDDDSMNEWDILMDSVARNMLYRV